MDNASKLREMELFLFDMDGTIYIGEQLFDFTKEMLRVIRETGRKYLYITNNSSRSVEDTVKKLERLGIDACPEDFLTSSQATIHYLKNHLPDAVLYVCGTRSLVREFQKNGFEVTDDLDKVTCVIMGNDNELTFKKLEDVCKLLLLHDVEYIATNPDYVCPTEFGSVPDCGSMCDMIYNCTKRRPIFIGKPEPLMIELAMELTGVSKEHTAVVGDRIYTDVKSGLNAGALGVLVMSGETDEKILEKSEDKPDLVLKDCGEILDALKVELE